MIKAMNTFRDKNILVVGGAGFVGSNLVNLLLKEKTKKILIVDNLLSSDISNVPEDDEVEFLFGSITNDKILEKIPEGLDYVFHLACYHGNQSSIADPIADHENNSLTTLKLLERLKHIKSIKKIVYAAAACAVAEKIYGKPIATSEDQPVSLYHDSPYSISKIIGELYGNYYFERHGLPFVKARFSNVYGPREILGAGRWRGTKHTVWRNVIPSFIWKALLNESLPLDNGGNTSRDFIFVEDMAKGLMACALAGRPGEVYNLATGVGTDISTVAKIINQLTGNKSGVDLMPARTWDRSGNRFASTEKAKNDLSFEYSVDIELGLRRTVDWTVANQDLIKRSIENHKKMISQNEN